MSGIACRHMNGAAIASAASEGGAPFVARRAINQHGCALPHCAPLLRLLRRGRVSSA
ncbi:MAG: hypothetical protein WBX50_04985 [Candidatus Deferrimicrobiaceae bacterium]